MESDNSLREGITELLSVIQEHSSKMRSQCPEGPQLAAAGLMRCCHSLRALCCLEDAGFGGLVGIFERHVWETSVVSLYVLLGNGPALKKLVGAHVLEKNKIQKGLKKPLHFLDWKGPKKRLVVEQIYGEVRKLLGERTQLPGISAYDAIYRMQSLYSAHANFETLSQYLDVPEDRDNGEWGVIPAASSLVVYPALTSAQITLHLAQYVFNAFGLPDHFWPPINEKLRLPS